MGDMMTYTPGAVSDMARGTGTAIATSRQAQEVQAQVFLAKKFPRDINTVYAGIIEACKRPRLASVAMYEYPRGGTRVTGPSIQIAEAIAQIYGNIDYGYIVLSQNDEKSEVEAFCFDLQNNARKSVAFTVPHIRQTKKGTTLLTDPRDIYELIANNASRRVRSCILSIIPGDLVDEAISQCQETLASGSAIPIADRIRAALAKFQEEFGVPKSAIEKRFGCKAEAFTEQTIISLGNIYNSLHEGRAQREAYFEIPDPDSEQKEEAAPDGVKQTSPEAAEEVDIDKM